MTSGILLEHYLGAAEEAVARATNFGPRPESKQYAQQTPYYFNGKEKAKLPKIFHVRSILGRELEIGDRPSTDKILAELQASNGGLRDLVRLIVQSKPFLSN